MTPEQFLARWKAEHINSGTQQADTPKLIENLLIDGENKGLSREMLAQAAGGGLVQYIEGSIREAIEEELR